MCPDTSSRLPRVCADAGSDRPVVAAAQPTVSAAKRQKGFNRVAVEGSLAQDLPDVEALGTCFIRRRGDGLRAS